MYYNHCVYCIAGNFRGIKISFILNVEVFLNKNLIYQLNDQGTPTNNEIFVGKIFIEVSLHTKRTNFLPHGNSCYMVNVLVHKNTVSYSPSSTLNWFVPTCCHSTPSLQAHTIAECQTQCYMSSALLALPLELNFIEGVKIPKHPQTYKKAYMYLPDGEGTHFKHFPHVHLWVDCLLILNLLKSLMVGRAAPVTVPGRDDMRASIASLTTLDSIIQNRCCIYKQIV